GTVAIVMSWGRSVRRISHGNGKETGAWSRARTDHGAKTVLCGAFWLKSMKIRAPRSSFHHDAVINDGCRRSSSRATATAALRTATLSCVGSKRTYTCNPRLPDVLM